MLDVDFMKVDDFNSKVVAASRSEHLIKRIVLRHLS
jgi:hypothetical protein